MRHRLFAAIYDRMLAGTEKAGLRSMRAELLAGARGSVLEIGAGTGLNLAHYPPEVTELTLTEPNPFMARRLRDRLESEFAGRPARVIETPAESLPFDEGTFDTVVCTLVLCSVAEPQRAIAEVERVLRAGGTLLYLEHVRGESPKLARWQDRLERPWGWIGDGCHPNRATEAALRRSGLDVAEPAHQQMPKAPPIVRPLISGSATRPAA
jgi:ubiquinone/menaquinone biosynthesis C-methylase UbiE